MKYARKNITIYYSTLKEVFEQLKINQKSNLNKTTVNTSIFQNYDNNRPQTAKIKDFDSIYNKSISKINLFQENLLFDNEDLYDKFRFNKNKIIK